MWNLKYDTGEFIYKTETDNRNRLTDIEQKLWLSKRKGERVILGVWVLGVSIYYRYTL